MGQQRMNHSFGESCCIAFSISSNITFCFVDSLGLAIKFRVLMDGSFLKRLGAWRNQGGVVRFFVDGQGHRAEPVRARRSSSGALTLGVSRFLIPNWHCKDWGEMCAADT